jgi:hypothetical protein
LAKRALKLHEKWLPFNHPDIALSLSNLAAFYDTEGKFAGAEPLYKRAL